MDEQAFWRLVAEYLAGLQTSGGQQNPGGDLFADPGMDNEIGMNPAMTAPPAFGAMGAAPEPPAVGMFTTPPPPQPQFTQAPPAPEPRGLAAVQPAALQKGSANAQQVVRTLSQPRARQTAVAQPPPANPPGRTPASGTAPAPYRGPTWDYQGFRTASGPSTATTPRNTSTSTARNVVRNATKRF